MTMEVYDMDNRKWQILDFTYSGNGVWNIGAITDFFGDYDSVNVSSIDEMIAFISNHAH